MRKIIFIFGLVMCSMAVSAQTTNPFPTTDSLRKFINKWIRNSAVDAFTNLRLNTALIGVTRFIDEAEGGGGGISPADTAAMLAGYTRLSRFMDSVAALRSAISGAGAGPAGPENSLQYRSGGVFAGDAGLTYNAITNKLTTDSVAMQKAVSNFYRLNPSLFFNPPDSISLYGHSWVVGQNASTFAQSFPGRMVDHYQLPFVNHAVGGRGIWESVRQHHQNINPGHKAITLVMTLLNDVRRGGTGYKTVRKAMGGMNSLIANHFLSAWTPAGLTTGTITRYGTWFPGYLSSTVGGKSVGNGAFTATLNDSIVYMFRDSTLVLGLIGADSISGVNYNYAVFDIYIDDVLYATKSEGNMTDGISDGNNDNGRSPFAIIIRGLSLGTHKVKLVNKTSGANFVVDYFGHLIDASQATPILIFHDPKLDATGYATSPNQANDAVINSINASVDSLLAAQWPGYPWYIARTNDYFINTTASGLDADHIHQNNLGGQQTATAGTTALPSVTIPADNNTILASTSLPYYKANDRIRQIALYDQVVGKVDTGRFIANSPNYLQAASININGNIRTAASLFSGSSTATTASAPAARFYTGGSSMLNLYKFSTDNYLINADTTGTTGVNVNIAVNNAFRVGTLSGGTITNFLTADNTATNKLAVTGNASFSSVVLGSSLTPTNAAITAGTSFSLPAIGLYKSNAPTDSKVFHLRTDDTSFNIISINDAVNASNYNARFIRSGTTPTYTYLYGKIRLPSTPDSVTTATGGFLFRDFTTGDIRATSAPAPALTSNYIGYGISGSLSGSTAYQYNGTNVTQSNSTARHYIVNTDALGSTSGGSISLYNDGTPSASNQSLGNLEFGARISGNYRLGATIRALSSGAWTDGSVYRTDLIFSPTASGSATPSVGMRLNGGGRLFVGGNTVASATLHLAGGSAGASGAPLKFTSGTNLTTPEAGAVEYDGTNLTATPGDAVRRNVVLMDAATPQVGDILMRSGSYWTRTAYSNVTTQNTTASISAGQFTIVQIIKTSPGASNITITISGSFIGQKYIIKKMDNGAGVVTINGAAGTFDGAASINISGQYETVTAIWDGSNWLLLP